MDDLGIAGQSSEGSANCKGYPLHNNSDGGKDLGGHIPNGTQSGVGRGFCTAEYCTAAKVCKLCNTVLFCGAISAHRCHRQVPHGKYHTRGNPHGIQPLKPATAL